jgi:hypothetical protein
MAADLSQSMFGPTPQQAQDAANQDRTNYAMQLAQMQDPFARAGFMVGQGASQLGQGLFGLQDPNVIKAQQTQQAMSGVDTNDPSALLQAAVAMRAIDPARAAAIAAQARDIQQKQAETKYKLAQAAYEQKKADTEANPFAKIDPSKFTPESLKAFVAGGSKDQSLLVASDKEQKLSDYASSLVDEGIPYGTPEFARRMKEWNDAAVAAKNKPNATEGKTHEVTANDGSVRVYDANWNLIKELGTVGKPTGTFEKAVNTQKNIRRDLDIAIPNLQQLTKDGGLLDQATGSGIGAAVDFGARIFGKALPGDIATGKLKPMVPRFEGPQSDKDVQSYKDAAGDLANPQLPTKLRKAAAQTILDIMTRRKNQFTTVDYANDPETSSPPSGNTSPPFTERTPAEVKALYAAGTIDKNTAKTILKDMGF